MTISQRCFRNPIHHQPGALNDPGRLNL